MAGNLAHFGGSWHVEAPDWTGQSGERRRGRLFPLVSWPALGRPPAILLGSAPKVVGGRDKPCHDTGAKAGHDTGLKPVMTQGLKLAPDCPAGLDRCDRSAGADAKAQPDFDSVL
jgi:hypothetical protein